MIGSRIKRARLAAGMSLRALAAQCGVSAMAISKYERDEMTPSSDVLLDLARALDLRTEFFFRDQEAELEEVEYRKHPDLPEKIKKQILAHVRNQLERWLALEQFIPGSWSTPFRLPARLPSSIDAMEAIENVAERVRHAWQLGRGPVSDLIDTFELHGIMVFAIPINVEQKFDGLSAKTGDKPIVVIGHDTPGDRQRFALAHELGHLVLKGRLAKNIDEEKACNRFAGAFLAPRDSAYQVLGKERHWIEPKEFQYLKKEWGLSMAGWMLRARDIGVLNRKQASQLWQLFVDNGWDKHEPGPQYEPEESRGFAQLVYRALAEDLIGESKAAELLGQPLADFVAARNMEMAPDDSGQ